MVCPGNIIIKGVSSCAEMKLVICKASKSCLVGVFKGGHAVAGAGGVNGKTSVIDDVMILQVEAIEEISVLFFV